MDSVVMRQEGDTEDTKVQGNEPVAEVLRLKS